MKTRMFIFGVVVSILYAPVRWVTADDISELKEQRAQQSDGLKNNYWPSHIRPPPLLFGRFFSC